jgi:type IV secretion system protein VirB10
MKHYLFLTVAAVAMAQDAPDRKYNVEPGTRVPLSLLNSVSTKTAAEGDRVYLESVFPILVDGKIVIPPGSYVAGTVTLVKRPGRVKGKGELYVRFDSLTLPNGVTRDFRGRIGALDGQRGEELDRNEGVVKSEGNKSGDAKTVGETTAGGASLGAIIGSTSRRAGMGAGIGAAAGATAGLVGVLMSRGPDAVLAKGTTIEMVLDRTISYSDEEIAFDQPSRRKSAAAVPDTPQTPGKKREILPLPGTSRLP